MKTTLILLLAVLGNISCTYPNGNPKANAQRSSIANIERDLPIGTSKAAAVAYLRTREIDCSYDEHTKSIYARINGEGGLVTEDTGIEIKLDNDGKVSKITVTKMLTGP